jgi:hypothetical protein
MSIQCTSPGWSDVWGMIAGATTQASNAIGAVTEAQMAKIFFSEYCLELAGASSCAGTICVFVMSSASRRTRVAHIVLRARDRRGRVRPTGDGYVRLQGDV